MQGSFKLGTIAGIEVRVHYTWLFAVLLIAWSLALGNFRTTNEGLGTATDWVLGIIAAVLLFVSVLIHELGHSLVAIRRGLRVDNITLFIFGGISSIAGEAHNATDEFLISVVGPVTSLVLAGVFWLLNQALAASPALAALTNYLAFANLLLGLFNIVPAFPLDGGRVFRSIVWAVTGDMSRATRIASYVGQAFAYVLIAYGAISVLTGNFVGGLWTAFIGWFLNNGAEATRQQMTIKNALGGVAVTTVMDRAPEVASPDLTVRDFMLEYALRRGKRALPVVENGRLVGIMSTTDAKHIDQDAWPTTPVSSVMTRAPLRTLPPEADLAQALELMVENDIHQLPIVQGGGLIGMLSRADVMRYMQMAAQLQARGAAPAATAP
jgi:Zn-dependent protease/predicted transcriptional regulator